MPRGGILGVSSNNKQQRIRVAIVEDYVPLLQQLRTEINLSTGLQTVGTYETCEDAIAHMDRAHPDVVVMDIGLPKMSGIDGLKILKERWPRTKVLMFSADDRKETIREAFLRGAAGYLDKGSPRQKLAAAIERVHEGRHATSERVSDELVEIIAAWRPLLAELSPRERDILDEFARGGTIKEIAARLDSKVETIKTHARRIALKSGVSNLRAAAWIRKQTV